MARTKASLGNGARLTDFLSTSLLARVYPSSLIGDLLDARDCNSQRQRSFPATAVVYYCMALSLYPEAAYGDVFDAVAQGLAWRCRNAAPASIKASSISVARARLSWPIFKDLQERACQPMALAASFPDAFYRGLRLMAIDGSNFEIPDEPDNIAAFGYPGSRTGVAGYPQAQCAILVECATHAIVGANIGAYRDAEWTVAKPLLARLDASMLCLADRGFNGYEHWRCAQATGAQLLWRCAANRQLPVIKPLPDGSFLSEIRPSKGAARSDKSAAVSVRVIEYSLGQTPNWGQGSWGLARVGPAVQQEHIGSCCVGIAQPVNDTQVNLDVGMTGMKARQRRQQHMVRQLWVGANGQDATGPLGRPTQCFGWHSSR
jgi:hypothetical protein